MVLSWDNLKEKKCPRCGSEMTADGQKLVCKAVSDTRCRFVVHQQRAESIIEHGTYHQKPSAPRFKLKWQLLHENKCPACAGELRDLEGRGVFTCDTTSCSFKIREYRMDEMLSDPHHACNTYWGTPYEQDIQNNLKIIAES